MAINQMNKIVANLNSYTWPITIASPMPNHTLASPVQWLQIVKIIIIIILCLQPHLNSSSLSLPSCFLQLQMASSTLSPLTPSHLRWSKSGIFAESGGLVMKPSSRVNAAVVGKDRERGKRVTCQATTAPADDRVPDMGKRKLMNLLLLGALSLPTGYMLVPYASFFAPPGGGNASAGTVAKDALGNDIKASEWLKKHGPGDRTLTQGLKGDPTYLIVESDRTLATYGINAVCTHLGCVVPWNTAENKFICPCHGSQYNNQGKVVRGPAPLSLALAHCDVDDDKVIYVPWTETDFRTGEEPWWT